MVTFEEVFSIEHLFASFYRSSLGKRYKDEVIEFSKHYASKLWELYYDLKYGRYRVSGYKEFTIYEPKERLIQAISFKDRVVQHCLVDYFLTPYLGKLFIYDNAACQKDKGVYFAIKRLRHHLTSYYRANSNKGYYIKLDIKKYFDSIPHNRVKELLKEYVSDEKILLLLYGIIDSFREDIGKGFPMGNQTSQFIALLYLSKLDHIIKEQYQIKGYVRYMDDMILLVKDKITAIKVYEGINDYTNSVALSLNHKFQIHHLSEGIEFLGWRFNINRYGKITTAIKHNTKVKIKGNVHSVDDIKKYKGLFHYGDTYRFKSELVKKTIVLA